MEGIKRKLFRIMRVDKKNEVKEEIRLWVVDFIEDPLHNFTMSYTDSSCGSLPRIDNIDGIPYLNADIIRESFILVLMREKVEITQPS